MKKIDKNILKLISKNLMIEISDREAEIIFEKISESINKINEIKEFNLENVEPMDFPNIVVNNDFRKDIVKEFENKDKLLDCAKEKKGRYIKV